MSRTISIVGAGGKTTLIKKLSAKYRSEGKRVLVITSTHMQKEADTDVSCDSRQIIEKLDNEGYCMAGAETDNAKKIGMLSQEVLDTIIPYADIVLIEADGGRHHSVKFPREMEPVILDKSDEIIIVMGLWDIGKKAKDVIFAYKEMAERFEGQQLDDILSFYMINDYLIKEYLIKLDKLQYRGEVRILFSQRDKNGKLSYISYEEAKNLYDK